MLVPALERLFALWSQSANPDNGSYVRFWHLAGICQLVYFAARAREHVTRAINLPSRTLMYPHTNTSGGKMDETGVSKSAISGRNGQWTRRHSRGCPAGGTPSIQALRTWAQREHPGGRSM